MPNRPELQPMLDPGGWRGSIADKFVSIAKFLNQPPGIARVTPGAAAGDVVVQVTNRSGQPNTGRWIVKIKRAASLGGAFVNFVPTVTVGQIVQEVATPETSLECMTDQNGTLALNVGAALAAGEVVYALVLGEPGVLVG